MTPKTTVYLKKSLSLLITASMLINVSGCGRSGAVHSHVFGEVAHAGDEPESPDNEGDVSQDQDVVPETPTVTGPKVNVNPTGANTQITGKVTTFHFFEMTENANGTVEVPASGIKEQPAPGSSEGPTPAAQGTSFTGDRNEEENTPDTPPEVMPSLFERKPDRPSPSTGPRGDDDTPKAHPREVYPNLEALETAITKDRQLIESGISLGVLASQAQLQKADEALDAALVLHNTSVTRTLAVLPGWQALTSANAGTQGFQTSASTSFGKDLRNTRLALAYVRKTVPGASEELLGVAAETLKNADAAGASGDLYGGQERRKNAMELIAAASTPGLLPVSPKPEAYDLSAAFSETAERTKSFEAAKVAFGAANFLDEEGFPGLSSELRASASLLLNIALGVARVAQLVDVPLNVMEAFAGTTVDFDDDGNPRIREASHIERAFAIGMLAFMAAGAVTTGWPVVLGAGIIAGLGKAVEKQMAKQSAEKAALEIAEKGLVGAEKTALEQAAQEAAQNTAKTVVQHAQRVASTWVIKNLSPKALTHIIDGDFNAVGQLKGGMHTGPATDRLIARLSPQIQKNVTRETLANGVERTVFLEKDKVLTDGSYKATARAAEEGRGVAGGKTSFPRNWGPDTIDAAIGEVLTNGRVIWSQGNGKEIIEGTYLGVTIQVAVGPKSGGGIQVNSAYPRWNQ